MPLEDLELEIGPSLEEDGEAKQRWGLRQAGFNFALPEGAGDDPVLANVRGPAQAMLNAGHGRAPVAGEHNWIPRGPRNVGGRVRALAFHPHDDNVVFAGASLGGVFKSVDGGETWFPLWHDEESLTIAGIALHHVAGRPLAETTVWVATGEPRQNGFTVPGAGIFRSTDNGENFQQVATVAQLDGMDLVEAIACHPTDRNHAWAVGKRGVFRVVIPAAGGPAAIDQFDAGVEYSDAAFGAAAPAGPPPVGPQPHPFVIYLARKLTARGDIVRIDDPTAAVAAITPAFAAGSLSIAQPVPAAGSTPIPPLGVQLVGPGSQLIRAKLAVCRDTPAVLFVAYAQAQAIVPLGFGGVFRTQQANGRPAFNAVAWVDLPLAPAFDFLTQSQGSYNLAIGVSPVNADHLFVGMIDLFLSRNANQPLGGPGAPTWVRSVMSERFGVVDFTSHPDFHAVAFEQQRNPPRVLVGSDGGIYANRDYQDAATTFPPFSVTLNAVPPPPLVQTAHAFPLAPEPTHRWQRRFFGLTGGQAYDLTGSPVAPTLFGCGFIDNGCWFSSGGDTWRFVSLGDGSFIAFDAEDPYRFVVTWQRNIEAVEFGGGNQSRLPPAATPLPFFTPNRVVARGFSQLDPPQFAGDTLMHPTRPHEIVTTRRNRLYRSTDGESFSALPVGSGIEIVLTHLNATAAPQNLFAALVFEEGATARRLGLVEAQARSAAVPSGAGVAFRFVNLVAGPWSLADGDVLRFNVLRWTGGAGPLTTTPVEVRFASGGAIRDLARTSASELAALVHAAISAAGPPLGVQVMPTFLGAPSGVMLRTGNVPGASIHIDGTAALPLGVAPGVYLPEAGRPASLSLQAVTLNEALATPGREVERVDLTGRVLRIAVNGGPLAPVGLGAATIGDPRQPSAALLARAIAAAAGGALEVTGAAAQKSILLLSETGAFDIAGTALPRLSAAAAAGIRMAILRPGRWTFADVGPVGVVDRRLSLTPPGLAVIHIDFTAAAYVDRTRAAPEEIVAQINTVLGATGVAAADLRALLAITSGSGDPTELAHAPSNPAHLWVGGADGHVFRSTDDGALWSDVTDPRMLLQDRRVEAIAVDPTDPAVVYLGLSGKGIDHANDAGMLFKTFRGGDSWVPIGDAIRATDGTRLPIVAIEIDSHDPRHLYVATPAGVWFSDDGGGRWHEHSQGLPNVQVMDLALEPRTRTLRAATWGRGTWERHIGDRPPRDRRVFIRASVQDQGFRPLLDGHDPFATTPLTATVISSPDIKNSPFRPEVGADDRHVDGVEFDELIAHEEPVEGPSSLFVQVHNHGSFPATAVRVTALWAEVGCGPPGLDAAFWTALRAGAPVAPPRWTLIGSQLLAGELVVGHPRVMTLPVVWPASIGDARQLAILVVVTSAEDGVAGSEVDVTTLIGGNPKVALRLTETRRLADAREIHLASTDRLAFTITGGSAAAALGLPVGAAARFHRSAGGVVGAGGPGTFSLAGVAPPRTLVLDDGVAPARTVTFEAPDIPDPANASADQIRRTINRQLTLAQFGGRAIVGGTDLSIAVSSTDEGARPLALPSTHLADMVVRGAAVAGADRPGLFELIARLEADQIRRNQDNFFLLRVSNRGTADQPSVRCRIYRLVLPLAAAPVHVAEVIHPAGVPARGADVVQLTWNPGALAADFAVILATADHATGEPLALPPGGFADLEAVRGYCRTTNNAAYRVIPVS
jgi:photosystem II stability/assembly factor-like uncharacterized protein